jgi:hypothetical protein
MSSIQMLYTSPRIKKNRKSCLIKHIIYSSNINLNLTLWVTIQQLKIRERKGTL